MITFSSLTESSKGSSSSRLLLLIWTSRTLMSLLDCFSVVFLSSERTAISSVELICWFLGPNLTVLCFVEFWISSLSKEFPGISMILCEYSLMASFLPLKIWLQNFEMSNSKISVPQFFKFVYLCFIGGIAHNLRLRFCLNVLNASGLSSGFLFGLKNIDYFVKISFWWENIFKLHRVVLNFVFPHRTVWELPKMSKLSF